MLRRLWEHGNPHSLLVGEEMGAPFRCNLTVLSHMRHSHLLLVPATAEKLVSALGRQSGQRLSIQGRNLGQTHSHDLQQCSIPVHPALDSPASPKGTFTSYLDHTIP